MDLRTRIHLIAASLELVRDHSAEMDMLMQENNATQDKLQQPAQEPVTCFVVMVSGLIMRNAITEPRTVTLHPMLAELIAKDPLVVMVLLILVKTVMMELKDQADADQTVESLDVGIMLWTFILVRNVMEAMVAAQPVLDFVETER